MSWVQAQCSSRLPPEFAISLPPGLDFRDFPKLLTPVTHHTLSCFLLSWELWGERQALLGSCSSVGDREDLPPGLLLGRPGRALQNQDAILEPQGVTGGLSQPGSASEWLGLQGGVSCGARSVLWAHRVRSKARSVPGAHRVRSRIRSVPGAYRVRSIPWANRICSRAHSVPWAHRVRSRAGSVP